MNYSIELSVHVRRKIGRDEFDQAFEAVAEALYNCTGVEDADLAGDFDQMTLTFTFNVLNAQGPVEATTTAIDVARTALHASGGSTPNWESRYEFVNQTIESVPTRKKGLVKA